MASLSIVFVISNYKSDQSYEYFSMLGNTVKMLFAFGPPLVQGSGFKHNVFFKSKGQICYMMIMGMA